MKSGGRLKWKGEGEEREGPAEDAARPPGSTRREDHQSYRGECWVPCNHGAEPRADKPNQKR